ncbi:M23 family metallopeptidase [Magnetofaba australis]|nr:M23 family metallopeptidase [Magnetofaba australis]
MTKRQVRVVLSALGGLVSCLLIALAGIWYFQEDREQIAMQLEEVVANKDDLYQANQALSLANQDKQDRIHAYEEKYGLLEQPKPEPVVAVTPFDGYRNALVKRHLLASIPNGNPVPFKGVTSPYGRRVEPIRSKNSGPISDEPNDFHGGIDLRAKTGTAVAATADGVVEFSGRDHSGYGVLVILRHDFGFRTAYAHLSKTLVKKGDFVTRGDVIARSGNSGRSSGPHLHYEVRFIRNRLNPNKFMAWTWDNYEEVFKEKQVKWRSLVKILNRRLTNPAQPSLQLAQK